MKRRASRWQTSIWRNAVLTIRATKFYKSRLVPIGPQLATVLANYMPLRRRGGLAQGETSFLLANRDGTRLASSTVQAAFDALRRIAGVHGTAGGRQIPRLHDLRHSFAVHSLTAWYRQGAMCNGCCPYSPPISVIPIWRARRSICR